VVGLCLGAFAVAEAGLMGGRPAVIHRQGMQELALRHPEPAVVDSELCIDHDDVMTSAGTASSLDACLHLVRKHLSAAAANRVARSLPETTHWGVGRTALACGFGSAVTLRQNFIATHATTPSAYRHSSARR
jgi:transcriptional regulator GlxA family with amidase domain